MAVNWYWKHKLGTITLVQEHNEIKNTFKLNIYCANCLGAIIYEYRDKETHKDMYKFMGFWNNRQHLANCLGLTRGYKDDIYKDPCNNYKKIKLNMYYRKDALTIAELFVKAGHKVELYYKEPKE